MYENKKKSLILGQQSNSKKAVKMGRREYLGMVITKLKFRNIGIA